MEAQQVYATLTKDDQVFYPSMVKVSCSTNNWPNIFVELVVRANKGDKAIPVDLDMVEYLRQFKDENDTYQLKFGVEKEIVTVDCYVSAVNMEVSTSNISISLNLLPEYTRLDRLDLRVFRNDSAFGIHSDIDGVSKLPKASETPNLMEYVLKCFNHTKDRWNKNKDAYYSEEGVSEITRETVKQISNNNEEIYHLFQQLLEQSKDSVGNLYNINEIFNADETVLYSSIINTITQESNSFLSTIVSLANLFNLVYLPEINNVGKFIKKEAIVEDAELGSIIPVIGAYVSSGNLAIGRIGYASTTGQINPDIDGAKSVERNVIVIFPEQIDLRKATSHISIPPPPWLPRHHFVEESFKIIKGDPSEESGSNNDTNKNKLDFKDFKKTSTKVLQDWCKQEFYYQKYGSQQATVQTFFRDLSQLYGKVIQFGLFRGFVDSITQSSRSGGEISTSLGLIGVLFEGEKPEGK